jgi:hypothetical protein
MKLFIMDRKQRHIFVYTHTHTHTNAAMTYELRCHKHFMILYFSVTAKENTMRAHIHTHTHTLLQSIVKCLHISPNLYLEYSCGILQKMSKDTAIQLQAPTGPEVFRLDKTPRTSTQQAHEGGKVVSSTHRPPLHPRKYSWYSFLLEAEPDSGP